MRTVVSAPPSPTCPDRGLTRRWNHDWDVLCRSAAGRAALRSWAADPVLGRFPTLPAVLAGAADDPVLARLVARVGGDRVAGRVVLQRLVGPMVVAAGRVGRRLGQPASAVFDDLMTAAWLKASRYDVTRAGGNVAVNLVMSAVWEVGWKPDRRRLEGRAHEVPFASLGSRRSEEQAVWQERLIAAGSGARPFEVPLADQEAAFALLDVVADAAAAGLPQRDVELLGGVALHGWSPAEMAAAGLGCERTLRWQRARALARLRELVAA